jgi:hypothetical protein
MSTVEKEKIKPIKFTPAFPITSFVWCLTEPEYRRIVVGFVVEANEIKYRVKYGAEESEHYDYELTDSPIVL